MNFLSMNIRGLGVAGKDSWVKRLKQQNGVSFVALQETQFRDMSGMNWARSWGNSALEAVYVDARGRSGGLVSLWDPCKFTKLSILKHQNFILIKGFLKEDGTLMNILNIYAPQKLVEKRQLWDHIASLVNYSPGLWCLLGDFNSVRYTEERKSCFFDQSDADIFNFFIDSTGLLEYGMKGGMFTCLSKKGSSLKFSKIDRVLVNMDFFNRWPEACLRVLPRYLSDHNPLLLTVVNENFGSRPFRWFNSWLDRDSCVEVVSKALKEFNMLGAADVVLSAKLRYLKSIIIEWKKQVEIKEGEELKMLKNDLERIEADMEFRDLLEEEEWVWQECKKGIEEYESFHAKDLLQKSRVSWAKFGDDNTAFFHGIINGRKASNSIQGLMVNGVWVSNPKLVKREVLRFFSSHFKETIPVRPILICEDLKKIPDNLVDGLIMPFTKEEIKLAVCECGKDKAPGPDGYNFSFVRRFWPLLEDDFMKIFLEFFDSGSISRGCASSFITLIPKTKNPLGLKDFRPITLVGIISKVLSKVLSLRLKKVIGFIISENQTGFLSDRNILDGPLVANEVLSWCKRRAKSVLFMKIDFEKAYDNVNWAFLLSILEQMGFPEKWRLWIKGILVSARSAVLVNGSPTFEFQCYKGLRQGDPISPFLFLIVMEALTCLFNKASKLGIFEGVSLAKNGPLISHLFFADDALIMGKWSENNILVVARILRIFYLCSGLKFNIHKSFLYGTGVANEDVENMASVVGCRLGSFPFDYLGVSVGANMNRINGWRKVVDVFEARLSSWKAKLLSIGGRLTLIKSVLHSLPIYFFSLYKAPVGVIEKLESLMKRFLWSASSDKNKLHWVAWETVTRDKNKGGLGISHLRDVNEALLSKWAWRFRVEDGSLWKLIIMACHNGNSRWSGLPRISGKGGVWSAIVKNCEKYKCGDKFFLELMKGKVGEGSGIRFWEDAWLLDVPLMSSFPFLYRASASKRKLVMECRSNGMWSPVDFARPMGWDEVQEWAVLSSLLSQAHLSAVKDSWEWAGSSSFSIAEVKSYVKKHRDPGNFFKFKWVGWVPLKYQIFAWQAEMDRIPTVEALSKRNVFIPNDRCKLCDAALESSEHIFSGCSFSYGVWTKIWKWCGLNTVFVFHTKDLLLLYKQAPGDKWAKKIVQGIILVTFWLIWKARNEKTFRGIEPKVSFVVGSVKSMSYLWFKNRTKYTDLSWQDWCNSPLYLM